MNRFKHSFCSCFLILFVCTFNPTSGNDFNDGIGNFASEFYSHCVKEKPGNVIVSPLSVSNALILLSQGADGNTYEQLKQTLHLSNDKLAVANQFLEHRKTLDENVGDCTLSIVNRIYVQHGHQLNKTFEEIAVSKFQSGVELLDFADSEKCANTINQFVEEETKGNIKGLVQPNQFDSNTQSVLVNAIYFKGEWEKPFLEEDTRKNDFYNSETEKVQIDFMYMDDEFSMAYIKDLHATALELEYTNSNITFVIVLPDSRTGLIELESKLKDYKLENITDYLYEGKCKLFLPKFKVEYEIELSDVLQKMGITEVFSSTANLSGLLDSSEQLKVSKAVHKAVIEINERGSEAAAVIESFVVPLMGGPEDFGTIRVDHPFIYFICDAETNTILFSGRIERFD